MIIITLIRVYMITTMVIGVIIINSRFIRVMSYQNYCDFGRFTSVANMVTRLIRIAITM